ncbi:MAG: ral secretion pathway protein [Cyanobacteriota bacterium]
MGWTAAASLLPLAWGPWVGAAPPPTPAAETAAAARGEQRTGSVVLRVRRQSDAVDLVIEGTGTSPELVQSTSSSGWQGQLTIAAPNGLRLGPQRLSLPEAGLQLVTLSGGGRSYQIEVLPSSGLRLNRPVVSADGQNLILTFPAVPQAALQTLRPNLNQPGAVPQAIDAPPLQPRAVAPPLGDMAVGTMVLRNTSYVDVRGPRVTMTLRNAPARDALMALAQLGGYGFVFVGDQGTTSSTGAAVAGAALTPAATAAQAASPALGRTVTVAFAKEPFARAFNAVLLASGLSAKLEGNLLIVGQSVASKGFGARLSKVYRLNQVGPNAAADYLANLGASVTKTNTIATAVTQGVSQNAAVSGGANASTTQSVSQTVVESYGASSGPLLGLAATTDNRLRTITLVGDASVVMVAEQYLRQLDLRQRQVALSVRILDVSLDNDSSLANSFAFRSGNSFILSQSGALTAVFGAVAPPAAGANQNAAANPGLTYPNNQLVDQITALVTSSNSKVLASPTLILSENPEPIPSGASIGSSGGGSGSSSSTGGTTTTGGGSSGGSIGRPFANEAFVTVGEQVITSYQTVTSTSAPPVCTPVFSNAGLTFGARISNIDDNGFVTFALSPEISAAVGVPQAVSSCGTIRIINRRRLDTGNLRVRDGQTLILTGVISDETISTVRKWPVLGDIPLIGQFFRGSSNIRANNELVIMVTPKIINDEAGGVYGYGFTPSSNDGRQFMGRTSN